MLAGVAALGVASAACGAFAQARSAATHRVPTLAELEAKRVHYNTAEVDGIKISHREGAIRRNRQSCFSTVFRLRP